MLIKYVTRTLPSATWICHVVICEVWLRAGTELIHFNHLRASSDIIYLLEHKYFFYFYGPTIPLFSCLLPSIPFSFLLAGEAVITRQCPSQMHGCGWGEAGARETAAAAVDTVTAATEDEGDERVRGTATAGERVGWAQETATGTVAAADVDEGGGTGACKDEGGDG